MKKFKLINLLLIVATSLLLVNCTTEPIPGPAGENGIDGVNGVDGATGTAECAECHNVTNDEAVHASYLFSGHAAASTLNYARFGKDCSECHSSEGYVDWVEYGSASEDGYAELSPISCNTCHSKHTSFDFENDALDYALRNIDGVDLIIGTGVLDFESTSNNCTTCHQPRRTPPVDDGNGMFMVTSHYGPHYGAQSTMLEGMQGAEIAGSEAYPGQSSSTHRQGSSCVKCHMTDAEASSDGLHTMTPNMNSCTTCHPSATDFDINGVQTEVTALMTELEGLLQIEGILDADGELVTGLFPVGVANAYWNWEFTYQDHSHGVHNPTYNLALLKNSIESLNAN